ncbi:MAG: helix-turn-helix transcriptional regulator [Actinobacteria bacterium]|nr:helix-turn-helix transcriptional regulator [Actinomycetota bacterium]
MGRETFTGQLDLLLLAALRDEERHGYAVIEHVRDTSAGRFDYAEGTVYPALRRMEDDGLIKSRWSDNSGRRRRLYRLTASGRRALRVREEDWASFRSGIEAVISGA